MEFINYTTYQKAEDIKRLEFITSNIHNSQQHTLRILEIGCGNGNISYQLAKYKHQVTGIDISETTIQAANARYGNTPGLQFKVANAEDLHPAEHLKYDAIVCSEVLEHLYNPEKLTANFRNLLKPNGVVIVTVPNGNGPREAFITKPSQKLAVGKGLLPALFRKIKYLLGYRGQNAQTSAEHLEHINFFTIPALKLLAAKSGFEIVKKQAGNFVENVFPFSLITKHAFWLQKFDCYVADVLPLPFTSAFYTVWKLKEQQ